MAGDTVRDFKRLLELLGQLLFHWCRLEETLDEELRRLDELQGYGERPEQRPLPFNQRVATWRRATQAGEASQLAREVSRLRVLRNLVTHHLAEVSGRPGEEPFIRCDRRLGGKVISRPVNLAELEEAVEAIDQCRGRLRNLSRFECSPWS